MRTPRLLVQTMATIAVAATTCGTAGATVFAPEGGRGDRSTELRCPVNHFLVGLKGRTGSWVDQLALVCRKLAAPEYATGPQTITSGVGGGGGSPTEMSCALGSAIREIGFMLYLDDYTKPNYVAGIVFACQRPRDGAAAGERTFGINDYAGEGMAFIREWAAGGNRFRRGVLQSCPGNEYAAGLAVRHGVHVNAVGLICEDFNDPESKARREPVVIRADIELRETVGPGMEDDTNRVGADYRRLVLNERAPATCQRACKDDPGTCRAWTYVRPGVQGPQAICYLKKEMPAPTANGCCISGVERKVVRLGKKP